MQKSRLQGPRTFHSVFKGPRFISNTLTPRSEPRKAVPSLNVPTCAFFENNLIPGELKLKTLNMEHFVQRQSGDSFTINYCTQFSKKNSSIQNGSISIGRSNSRIAFLGLRKRIPLWTTVLCPKMEEPQFGKKNKGKPKPSISARTPLCKSYGFCSQKGQVPFRNFHSPWRFWKKRHFHGELVDKGRLTWNILHLILFYPTKRREFGNPKL